MAKILYFDLLSGASGDMILAALVECGVPVNYLNKELGRLGIPGLSVKTSRVNRNGIMCGKMVLRWNTPKEYRHLHDILHFIKKGKYGAGVNERCESVLDRIATAEAKAHGIPKDHVHFHEIGAVDTIVDIVGACLAIDYLNVDALLFSTLTEGHGTITTEHGVMPVPAPATAALIKGFHVTRLPIPTELLTPTGAALLTTLGKQAIVCPPGVIVGSGNGCGTKVFDSHPNFLRATLIGTSRNDAGKGGDAVTVLETDMDHISGEIMGNVAALLMERGALDFSWTPIFMKKGRPGYRLTVIVGPDKADELTDVIIIHTRTLGVRRYQAGRVTADREVCPAIVSGHAVSEKRCGYKGHVYSKIENDDLVRIAKVENIPVVEVAERYNRDRNRKNK